VVGAVLFGMVAAAAAGFLFVRSSAAPPSDSETDTTAIQASSPPVEHGSIHVVTTPPGAAVWINGALRPEKTPAKIDQLPLRTPLDVKLTMEGYAPIREDVSLDKTNPVLRIEHALVAGTVTLVVETNAPGAKLLIDDKLQDGLRVEGLSADEEHKVVVTAKGYVSRTTRFRVGPNETKELTLNLEREDARKAKAVAGETPAAATSRGKLNVSSRGGFCNVTVGGQSYGPTPVGGIVLPTGNHVVGCKPASGAAKSMGVTISPDQTARITFTLDG
jgi:hypothetical protein